MKLLTEAEAQEQVNNPKNLINRVNFSVKHRVTNGKGRILGALAVPQELREQVVDLCASGEYTQKQIAEKFDLSEQAVSSYMNGKVGTRVDEVLTKKKDERLEKIKDTAIEKVMEAFGLLNAEKMGKCSARDLASIARDMAKIAQADKEKNINNGVQLIVFAPTQRSEEHYTIVKA